MALRPMQRPVLIMYTEVAAFFYVYHFYHVHKYEEYRAEHNVLYFNLHSTAHEVSQIYFKQ